MQPNKFILHCLTLSTRALCLLALSGAVAHAASFNCAKATTEVEKRICSDQALGALDAQLAKTYSEMTANDNEDQQRLIATQRQWLKKVRDACQSVTCLTQAYQQRINVLTGSIASFDCGKAASRSEKLICSEESLRWGDRMLGQAYQALRQANATQHALIAEQKAWIVGVRDRCADVACLRTAIEERSTALQQQREALIDAVGERVAYRKHAFFRDIMLWPKDASRTIALFATQASAKGDDGPAQDEAFIADIYVLDNRSGKVLAHGEDGFDSDAIALQGASIDSTDFATQMGRQTFGIALSYNHVGCAGYGGNNVRLYVVEGKQVRVVLPDVTVQSSSGMCQTECESNTARRELSFAPKGSGAYPDLIIRATKTTWMDKPGAPAGECKIVTERKRFIVPYDGKIYHLPEDAQY